MEHAASAVDERSRRTSIVVTAVVALALVVVAIIFAANTEWYFVFKMLHVGAAVIWVGRGRVPHHLRAARGAGERRRPAAPDRILGRDRGRATLPGDVLRRPRLRDRDDVERGFSV